LSLGSELVLEPELQDRVGVSKDMDEMNSSFTDNYNYNVYVLQALGMKWPFIDTGKTGPFIV